MVGTWCEHDVIRCAVVCGFGPVAALGEFFYTAAELHVNKGAVSFTPLNARFFEIAVEMSSFGRRENGYAVGSHTDATLKAAIVPGHSVSAASDPETFKAMMYALTLTGTCPRTAWRCMPSNRRRRRRVGGVLSPCVAGFVAGDGIMLRLHHHIEPLALHCPEELNKDTGESQGAQVCDRSVLSAL